jgi:hypothetical protein
MREFSASLVFLCLALVGCDQTATSTPNGHADPPPPPPTVPPTQEAGDITLNAAVRHQTIVGWEAHASASHTNPMFPLFQDTLLDVAADLGINRLRLEAWSGTEQSRDYYADYQAGVIDDAQWRCVRFATQNDNGDPNVIDWSGFHFTMMDELVERVVLPLRDRLLARGERLYVNVTYNSFVLQCPNTPYHHDSVAEYAEFALAVFLHLRNKYGLVPDAWNMILEPDNSRWRGTSIGQALVATANLLAQHGFTPEFIAPSATFIGNSVAYFDDMIKVPGVLQHVKEISYHRYRTNFTGIVPHLQQLSTRAQQHGLRTSMLEHLGADHHELHQDLTLGNVSAWQRFALAGIQASATDSGRNVYLLIDRSDPAHPVVRYASGAAHLFQYFRYIRPGAVRIDATSTKPAFDPVAFIGPDSRHVVVVKASAGGTFTVAGLPAGRYGIVLTTANARLREEPDVELEAGKALSATIPAAGVITIHAR